MFTDLRNTTSSLADLFPRAILSPTKPPLRSPFEQPGKETEQFSYQLKSIGTTTANNNMLSDGMHQSLIYQVL